METKLEDWYVYGRDYNMELIHLPCGKAEMSGGEFEFADMFKAMSGHHCPKV